jgi:methylglutaconyl-CoA hydratase
LDLFTSGRNFNAKDAKEMGLVKSFCKNENIENIISSETEPFLLNAPSAMSASKMLVKSLFFKIDQETVKFTVEALADVWENPEAIEGINAFFEKRKPNWLMEN